MGQGAEVEGTGLERVVMIPQIFIWTRSPIAATTHEAGCNPKIEFQLDVCLLRL
jgi:hypothetical protein